MFKKQKIAVNQKSINSKFDITIKIRKTNNMPKKRSTGLNGYPCPCTLDRDS